MGQCTKNFNPPPLFTDEQLAEWRREPRIEYAVDFGTGLSVSAEITVHQPSKEALIRARIHLLSQTIFEANNDGVYTESVRLMREEIRFLKLLL